MFDSKYGQIALSLIILVFSIGFLFYFYNIATVTKVSVEEIKVIATKGKSTPPNDFKIDLELFKRDKFKKLKAVGAETTKFNAGKRNPFTID